MTTYTTAGMHRHMKAFGADPERQVTLKGWIRSVRISKHVIFIMLSDGSHPTPIQLVVRKTSGYFATAATLHTGDCIDAQGWMVESKGAGQDYDMLVHSFIILGEAGPHFPIQKKAHGADYLRSIPHLRARSREMGAVFRLRSKLAQAVHTHFAKQGCFYVHTPIITGSDCEGAGEMFTVGPEGFFGDTPAHLTVSGQLEGEMLALALGRIYTFGPTFRAEHSATGRHLSEFWMVEPEIAFCDLEGILDVAQQMMMDLVAAAIDSLEDLDVLGERQGAKISGCLLEWYERITYTAAVEELQQAGHTVEWGEDLSAAHEQYLTTKYGPVFVTHWPRSLKPFYMRQSGDTVECFDLLVPGVGELIGGSVREHELDKLETAMVEKGMPLEHYQQYIDSRRYGTAPHAGFGLGFDRLVQWVCGVQNIRDVIPYPRAYGHMY